MKSEISSEKNNPQKQNGKIEVKLVEDIKNKKMKEEYLKNCHFIFGNNFLSYFFITWVFPLLKLGYKCPLDESLIPKLKDKDKSKIQYLELKKIFQQHTLNLNLGQGYKGRKLLKSLFQFRRNQIILIGVLLLILVGLNMYNSVLSYQIIEYIQQKQTRSLGENLKYFFILLGIMFLLAIIKNYQSYISTIIGSELSIGLTIMISDKVMKYPLISDKQFEISQILDYSQVDAERFQWIIYQTGQVIYNSLQILVGVFLLYFYVGLSFLIGLGILLGFVLLSMFLYRIQSSQDQKLLELKDDRLKLAEEILQVIKFIKINALEEYFLQNIGRKREDELQAKKKINLLNILSKFVSTLIPSIVVFVTLYLYFGEEMSASKAFFTIMVFRIVQTAFQRLSIFLKSINEIFASLERIQNFLLTKQINQDLIQKSPSLNSQYAIEIEDSTFLMQLQKKDKQDNQQKQKEFDKNELLVTQKPFITNNSSPSMEILETIQENSAPSQYIEIFKNLSLKILKNQLTLIIGPVGSGKSSLFHAVLNQMAYQKGKNPVVKINGSIALCSQSPWIISGTVKENILFHHPYDQQRLQEVIYYTCLEVDLKNLKDGIDTMIGEKGTNLSGGQRARVSLARALYSNKDIYLLDDVISAVDVNVGQFIMEKTIKNYLKEKTVVLATHAIKYLDHADHAIIMEKGRVVASGSCAEIKNCEEFEKIMKSDLEKGRQAKADIKEKVQNEQIITYHKKIQQSKQIVSHLKIDKVVEQLIIPEQQESVDAVTNVYTQFVELNGGKIFIVVILILMSSWTGFLVISNIYIEKWCDDNQKAKYFLYFYLGFAVISAVSLGLNGVFLAICEIKACRRIHERMMKSLIYAGLNQFFSRVPMGRILNRFSKDLTAMEEISTLDLYLTLFSLFSTISILILSIYASTLYALIPIGIVVVISIFLMNYYLQTQKKCIRLEKISNSPVAERFTETISGVETIRSYKLQNQFLDNLIKAVDKKKQMTFTRQSLEVWIELIISLFFLLINYSVFAYCIFNQDQTSSEAGLLLAFTSALLDQIQRLIYWITNFRLKIISVERLGNLTKIQPEIGYRNIKEKNKIELDPNQKGKIQLKNYSTRYREGLPFVLKNISITIEPGEKVGIVGRTGAGKSTLINSLLRILEPAEGELFLNGREIRESDLGELRKQIVMIVQEPTLMNSSFRENLDPAHLYSDEQILSVLRQSNILDLVQQKGGLGAPVSNNSISAGEKQLLCICRAILKRSKIILIDEATSNLDLKMDEMIEKVIKKSFKESTVVVIAHRLSSLQSCNKILVLNHGQIAQWGDKNQLLKIENGIYKQMVTQNDESYLA